MKPLVRAVPVGLVLSLLACPPPLDPKEPSRKDPPPDQCAADTNKIIPAGAEAVYRGTRQPALVPLDAAQQDAVVAVSTPEEFAEFRDSFCSGTLISADVVLTAQHCTAGAGDEDMLVLFGGDDHNPTLTVASVEVHEHPTLDLALIKLASAPANAMDVRPIPVAFAPPGEDEIGSLLENAGFGETDDGSHGRYFVTELFVGASLDFIGVDGEGQRGVCFGDSGGPSLYVTPQGDVRTLGALSFGYEPCGTTDFYQRVDVALEFVEAVTGPTPTGDVEVCPDSLDVVGGCSTEQTMASWCQNRAVMHDVCGAGEICIDARELGGEGFRCVAVEQNPCGAVSTFGQCDGEQLSWCDNGVLKERDCSACDGRCLLASETFGYTCVPSDCGGLDELGECDGSVSRWCDGVSLQTENCADYDQSCQYLGPELGYYCYDPEPCQGFTYYGQCDGTVLSWCEDNVPNQYDCAEDGQACVLIDEDTGYNCQ